jgi:hypothetical protein
VKTFDLAASTEDMEEAEGMTGEFVLTADYEKALALRELEREVLAALDDVAASSLVWYQNAGPFRGVCRAALELRKARGA